ncbi:MAG: hypothetical protein IKE38_00995, partial [Erysipelotrichaceae bacterium]|nr:hypothetical protein [Erysipelotrichaceae bacterium]
MSKKIICCLAVMTVLVTCGGCKAAEAYPIGDYLSLLAEKAGLSSDEGDHLESLNKWGVVKDDEMRSPDNDLTYDYLALTIDRLLEGDHEDYYKRIQDKGWIARNRKGSDKADRKTAEEVIDKAVKEINSRTFDSSFSFELNDDIVSMDEYLYYDERSLVTEGEHMPGEIIYLENDKVFKKIIDKADDCYVLADPSFAEIFESIELSDSGELDLSNAIDIPYGTLEEDTVLYENLDRNLLATAKKENTFTVNGFRVSYSIGSNSIDAHISRNVKGMNVFFDLAVSGIRPSYKWDYKDGKINEAYFKVDYNSSCELGVSTAKYHNYYLDFKELDASSFLSALKSVIKEKDDEVAATIRICQIKTPIPEIPTAFFNIDVLAKIYTSGKAEIVLNSTNENGFEVRNGCLRTIGNSDRDIDFIIGGSSRAALGLNFNLEAADHRLMDVEVDGGVRAAVSTTIHLYDDEGKMRSVKSNLPYSAVDDISRENEEVKICGDVSLNLLLDVTLNTSKTLLYKLSLTAKKTILDENAQVFGNKTHIENGTFMSSCTRKDRLKNKDRDIITADTEKIILERYSAVVKAGESYVIPIKALPEGYSEDDLVYKSSDPAVASVGKGTVKGLKTGSSEIMISTFDG